MIKSAIGPVFMLILWATISHAQPSLKKIDRLPPYKDFIVVNVPDGFTHVHAVGLFSKSLREYIPIGEDANDWSKILSIASFPLPPGEEKLETFSTDFISNIKNACKKTDISVKKPSKNEHLLKVYCEIQAGINLPGSTNSRREVSLYRILETDEALYHMHYAWHGDDDAVSDSVKRDAFFTEASDILSDIQICDLSADLPCSGLDVFTIGADPQPLTDTPPCRTKPETKCNPAIVVRAEKAKHIAPKDGAKQALLVIDISKDDLYDLKVAGGYATSIIDALKSGMPGVQILIRLPDPNADVTKEDRVKAGTFLTLIRAALINAKVVDPDTITVGFVNFI